jgi:fatty acid desaturase
MGEKYRYVSLAKRSIPGWYRQLLIELVVCWGAKAVLFVVDWKKALLLVLLPHLWAVYGITTVNLLQHDGCDEDHPYDHSRNFVGRVFNWLTFNNGFHGAHHDEPGLHWSLLAEAHGRKIHGKIDPRLEQRSLATYVFDAYVMPGTRRTFRGEPLAPPPAGTDGEWIPRHLLDGARHAGA